MAGGGKARAGAGRKGASRNKASRIKTNGDTAVQPSQSDNSYSSSEEPHMDTIFLSPSDMTHMKPFQLKDGQNSYPLIYLSPAGSISIVLSPQLIVESAVDHSIRVVNHGKYSAFVNGCGLASSIVHPLGRILHANNIVCGRFISSNDKMVIVGNTGALFTMDHLREAYMVSSGNKGTSAVSIDQLSFPKLSSDYTLLQFYTDSLTGSSFIPLCRDIVDNAIYDRRQDGEIYMQINGMTIRHSVNGDVVIDARPRHISCTADGNVHVRTAQIDMSVQATETAFIKYGMKRIHVSCSGMVVSDGTSCTSMDHFGRIIACS